MSNKKMFMLAVIFLACTACFSQTTTGKTENAVKPKKDSSECYIVRYIFPLHCLKGPDLCEQCKASTKDKKYCLIFICVEPGLETSSRMMELVVDGKKQWTTFNQVKVFESRDEARIYAAQHKLKLDF